MSAEPPSETTLEKPTPFGRAQSRSAVQIAPATEFYVAEDYHQDYYLKNSLRYKYYKFSCGRAQALEKIWGRKK